ncbi:MAG TPA: response regulator transcription factor [Clostridiales bacterium]|nr:response regulator transcription factor [Clostridiales bacterium]
MTRVLLVEDDAAIVAHLTEFLRQSGFAVESVDGQQKAISLLSEKTYDLLLVDIGLAEGNGFAVCAYAKANTDIPVIFLTASGDEYSVVSGLDMGADDYIGKPFRPRELVSRMKSVLRRWNNAPSLFTAGNITIHAARGLVYKNGAEVFLSALEYRILLLLFSNKGTVLPRSRIMDEIWDVAGEFVTDNTVTVYIKRLREKIEDDPQNPKLIKTVRGVGYRVDEP